MDAVALVEEEEGRKGNLKRARSAMRGGGLFSGALSLF